MKGTAFYVILVLQKYNFFLLQTLKTKKPRQVFTSQTLHQELVPGLSSPFADTVQYVKVNMQGPALLRDS